MESLYITVPIQIQIGLRFPFRSVYDIYRGNLEQCAERYGTTPEKVSFLQGQYDRIEMPVTYKATESWDTMILYVTTFAIILALVSGFFSAGIFAEEFRYRTDAIFFSSRYGRNKAVKGKMLAAAKSKAMAVAVCIPFILFCVSPFLGRALPFTTFFSLTPDQLVNVMNCARTPYIYQVGGTVFRQVPFVMWFYLVIALILVPVTYHQYRRTGMKRR